MKARDPYFDCEINAGIGATGYGRQYRSENSIRQSNKRKAGLPERETGLRSEPQ